MADYLPKYEDKAYPFTAGGAVTGGKCVTVNAAGQVIMPTADTAAVVGVAGFDAAANERVTVFCGGIQRLTAATAVSAGDFLLADSSGNVKPVASAGNEHAYIALSDAAVNAEILCLSAH